MSPIRASWSAWHAFAERSAPESCPKILLRKALAPECGALPPQGLDEGAIGDTHCLWRERDLGTRTADS